MNTNIFMRRKITGRLLCSLLALALAFSSAGCGAGEKADREREQARAQEEKRLEEEERKAAREAERAAEEAQEAAEQEPYYLYDSMEEYVASDLMQNILNSTLEDIRTDEIDFALKGEGNRLIYEYTYTTLAMTEEMKPLMEQAMDQQDEAFQSVADSLTDVVGVEQPTVVVRYLDMNGAQIAAREYPARQDAQ